MNEEELHKLFHRIELDKSSDSCGFEFADGHGCTFDNIATCYDDRLKLYELVKDLQQENKSLKKQLEQYQEEVCILDMRTDENIKYKNQQKEFIKYLENMLDDENDIFSVVRVKDVLQKYKSIIGDDK